MGIHFKTPKQRDTKQWELVEYLVSRGFRFERLYENREPVAYPTSIKDAPAFVEKYRYRL